MSAKKSTSANFTGNGETIALNKKAGFDYFLEDKTEAGLMLEGAEVKSLRFNGASLTECHAGEMDGAIWLFNLSIKAYQFAPAKFSPEPRRPRKLLLSKKQQNKFLGAVRRDGYTLIPTALYFKKNGRVKVEIALGRGKKNHDKRDAIKDRDWKREQQRLVR